MRTAKYFLLFLLMLLGVVTLVLQFRDSPWTPVRVAGVALGVPSFALWFLARVHLGKSFSITPQARALVTHGLYSKIRNPVYLFGSLFIAGMILFSGKLVYLAIFAIIIPMQLIRIKKEEKVLESAFGDEYRQYKQQTWF